MTKLLSFLAAATLLTASVGFAAAPEDFARGGMHFDAKAMDADKDGMISQDEFMKFHADMWDKMKKDKDGMVAVSSHDFGRGGMHFDGKAMDTDGDGMVSQKEYNVYYEAFWAKMTKDSKGMMSVADMQAMHDKMMMKHHHKAKAASDDAAAAAPK
jgi:hypothetical protein